MDAKRDHERDDVVLVLVVPTCPSPPTRPKPNQTNRWDDLEDDPALQLYTNYGIGAAYAVVCLVALVRG